MADSRALQKRILQNAEEEAQKIRDRARKEAQEIQERAQIKAQEQSQEMIEKAEQENQQLLEREETMARLQLRREILAQKQEEIGEVFSLLTRQIQKMDDTEYRKILSSMILSTVEEGTEEIIFSRKDRKRLGSSFIQELNQKRREAGKTGKLKLAQETREMDGGFILKGVGMENNNSFSELLAIQRDQLETQVAAILFKE